MLKEPKPKSNTNFVPNTELKTEQETTQETINNLNKLNTLDICIIGATLLARLTKKPKYTIFAVTMADIKKTLVLKKYTDPATKVLIDHYKHPDIFL